MYRAALRNVRAHKGRLLMTMLAVLLGTAFVAGTLIFSDSLGQSVKDSVSDSYSRISVQVTDTAVSTDTDSGARQHTGTRSPLTESTVRRIAALPETRSARGTVTGFAGLSDPHGNLIGSRGNTRGANWVPSAGGQDPEYPMTQGTGPTSAGMIAIDQRTASDNDFTVGDTVRAAVNGPVLEMTVTGIFTTDDPQVRAGGSLVLFDTATAQRLYLEPGQYDSIQVVATPGVSQNELRGEILPVVPHSGNITVKTGARLDADMAAQSRSGMSGMRNVLLAFAGIALFVGVFLIANTFTMLIAQRTRELALLRALGASRRQITNLVLLEALLVGVSASVAGLVTGIGIGAALQGLMGSMGSQVSTRTLVVSPTTVLVTLLTGTMVTTLATLLPGLRASRVAPVAAMRGIDTPATRKSLVVRNSIGVALAGVGLALVLWGAVRGGSAGNLLVAGGAVSTLVGAFVLTPALSRPAIALAGPLCTRLFGISGTLARQNAVRNPRRTAATASALTVGITLISALTVLGASVTHAIDKQVTQNMRADYAVSALLSLPVAPTLLPAIARTPGVAAYSALDDQHLRTGGKDLPVTGVDAKSFDQLIVPNMVSGSTTALRRGQILVDQDHVVNDDWTVGSTVPVTYPDGSGGRLTVGGVYQNSEVLGSVLMSRSVLSPHTIAPFYSTVLVKGATGATASLQQALKDSTGDNPLINVRTKQQMRDHFSSQISLLLDAMYALLALSVLIAALGVVNTLAMAVLERKREIGMLRAVGLSRGAVRRMVRLESVLIASFGAALGIAIGSFLAWAGVRLSSSAMTGLTTVFPYAQLAAYVVGAALVGLLAAVWPARRAARLNMLESISTD
ncbi:FtsX-like permease family protein [Streptomyces sp. NPDC096057]|uniref:ABC transporter permease n=1 Tax=Streptomyces sp. NPDC096057 TaxID=3155543 RepID=UPI00332BCE53